MFGLPSPPDTRLRFTRTSPHSSRRSRSGGERPPKLSIGMASTPISADEQASLDMFIESKGRGTSMLHASLGEAHAARDAQIMWLAVLGHLIVAELIGATVAKANSTFPRSNSTERFEAGILEFAPAPVSSGNADALWALRCSVGHIFGLSKEHPNPRGPHFRFFLDESGPLIRPASHAWDGTNLPVPYDDIKARRPEATTVNVRKLYVYVDRLVTNLRRHHAKDAVRLQPNLTPDEALAFRQIFVT